MRIFHPQIVKLIATITLISMVLLSIPSTALAFDLNIRDFFRNKVEESDKFITRINTKADQIVNISSGMVSLLTKGSFAVLEKRTGLSEQHKLYREIKHNSLERIGFGLGVVEGTKDFAAETVSLLAKLDSLPARTINLAYDIKEKPLDYKKKVINGGKMAAGVLTNPMPVLSGIYQMGKNTYAEAQKDPLKMGKLQGEVAVFGGTLLIGGGQVKSVSVASKANNAAKVGIFTKAVTSVKQTDWNAIIPTLRIPQINIGLGAAVPVTAGTGKATILPTHVVPSIIGSTKTTAVKNYPLDVKKLWNILNSNSPDSLWIREVRIPDKIADDISRWWKTGSDNWQKKLSVKEKNAITEYTELPNINHVLRFGENYVSVEPYKEKIELVSKALKKSTISDNTLLFRGTEKSILGKLASLPPEQLIGKIIEEKGFMSTSLFPQRFFIDPENGLQMVIKVPKGVKGAYLGDLSRFSREEEVLLDRGQKMIIREAKPLEDQIWWPDGLQIVAEIIK